MQEYQKIIHPFGPLFDDKSKILILGSFPSVRSREQLFFYGHPQNRFWKVLAGVLQVPVPQTIDEKKIMLHENHIALWDVIAECEIKGSSDSSIRNVIPTDLKIILDGCDIREIYANGNMAKKMFEKYQRQRIGREVTGLPSTSPANASWSLERLTKAWRDALTCYI